MPFSTKTSLHGIRRSPALEKQAELKKTQNVINQNFKTNRMTVSPKFRPLRTSKIPQRLQADSMHNRKNLDSFKGREIKKGL